MCVVCVCVCVCVCVWVRVCVCVCMCVCVCVLFVFCLFALLLFWSLLCFVASDFLRTICHLPIANVCVIIILSTGNAQISILLLCFLYSFVELMITMNE